MAIALKRVAMAIGDVAERVELDAAEIIAEIVEAERQLGRWLAAVDVGRGVDGVSHRRTGAHEQVVGGGTRGQHRRDSGVRADGSGAPILAVSSKTGASAPRLI